MRAARPLALGALVVAGIAVALGLLEIGLRVVDGMSGGWPPGVVDSPKNVHRQTPAGKRITANLDVVIERHPTSHRRARSSAPTNWASGARRSVPGRLASAHPRTR